MPELMYSEGLMIHMDTTRIEHQRYSEGACGCPIASSEGQQHLVVRIQYRRALMKQSAVCTVCMRSSATETYTERYRPEDQSANKRESYRIYLSRRLWGLDNLLVCLSALYASLHFLP